MTNNWDDGADDYEHIDDDDGGTESDADVCDRCSCERSEHEDGKGTCSCGHCRGFKEPGQ